MNKIKIGATILIVAIVCGSIGLLWGKMFAPQNLSRQTQLHADSPSDTAAITVQNQHTLLQEILVAVKTMQEQVNTVNDQQLALGQQINTSNDQQIALVQQIHTLNNQQVALFDQYESLIADAHKTGVIQPGAAEDIEQHAALADNLTIATPEGLQNWIEQQQVIQQMPEVQERRLMEKLEAVEWTDSLDPDSPISDG
jgi:hypothetical protein